MQTNSLAAINITLIRLYCLWANHPDLRQLTERSITYFCKLCIYSTFMFFFMFAECLILVGQGREFREFSKGHIKFLFLSRVVCLFVLARPDEILNEADYCWVAWLQQAPSVKTQAKEEEQYEMLVQVSPNGKSQEIRVESLISELLMDMKKDESAEYGNLVKATGPVLLWR